MQQSKCKHEVPQPNNDNIRNTSFPIQNLSKRFRKCLDIIVVISFRKWYVLCLLQLQLLSVHVLLVNLGFRRSQGRSFHEDYIIVPCDLPCDPQKWLLEIVVHLGRYFIVL